MPDDLDYSAIFPFDPAGKAAAMAKALRGQQGTAQRDTVLYGHPENVPGMMNEQAKEGMEQLGQGQQRALQGAQALREYALAKNQMRHEAVGEELAERKEQREAQNQGVEQELNRLRTQAELRLKDIEAGIKNRPGEATLEGLGGADAALKGLDEEEKKYFSSKVPTEYFSGHKAATTLLAGGLGGKDNPRAAEEAEGLLPSKEDWAIGLVNPGHIRAKFEAARNAVREKDAAKRAVMSAAGFNIPPAAKPVAPQPMMPKGAAKMQKNKKTGATRYVDAAGNEVK